MRATVFHGKDDIRVEEVARPRAGEGEAVIRMALTTLCPGGKERMRRLMETVRHGRVDLTPLLTHTYSLDQIAGAYELFGGRMDGVLKAAIKP